MWLSNQCTETVCLRALLLGFSSTFCFSLLCCFWLFAPSPLKFTFPCFINFNIFWINLIGFESRDEAGSGSRDEAGNREKNRTYSKSEGGASSKGKNRAAFAGNSNTSGDSTGGSS